MQRSEYWDELSAIKDRITFLLDRYPRLSSDYGNIRFLAESMLLDQPRLREVITLRTLEHLGRVERFGQGSQGRSRQGLQAAAVYLAMLDSSSRGIDIANVIMNKAMVTEPSFRKAVATLICLKRDVRSMKPRLSTKFKLRHSERVVLSSIRRAEHEVEAHAFRLNENLSD